MMKLRSLFMKFYDRTQRLKVKHFSLKPQPFYYRGLLSYITTAWLISGVSGLSSTATPFAFMSDSGMVPKFKKVLPCQLRFCRSSNCVVLATALIISIPNGGVIRNWNLAPGPGMCTCCPAPTKLFCCHLFGKSCCTCISALIKYNCT